MWCSRPVGVWSQGETGSQERCRELGPSLPRGNHTPSITIASPVWKCASKTDSHSHICYQITMSSARASLWSVTINNPVPADEECIAVARQRGWKVEGQLERGESGTPHYQLSVRSPQVRFSAVKKMFPRAHIEVARNAIALKQYVNKEDTRIGELPVGQELYPSLSKFWDLMFVYFADEGDVSYLDIPEIVGDWDEKKLLRKFDEVASHLIASGYHVETMAVNPQTRSCWKLYSRALMTRARRAYEESLTTSQTDRQTDNALDSDNEIYVPTIINNGSTRVEEESVCSQDSVSSNPSSYAGQVSSRTQVS